jgi:glycosyltransferase involved in cell wall biosynthesis
MLSVIIPAKNEPYLDKTIDSCLGMAEGEVEVIAVLDGYWPEVPIRDRKGLTLVHHTEGIGQRPAINEAARLARGKFLMKLDAHCILDKGYDVKLTADCEYDWTVIPRRLGVIEDGWKPRKTNIDYMRLTSLEEDMGLRAVKWDGHEHNGELIDDVMTCQGSGWFLHRDRFWELGGLDEAHGHWGAMGCEVGCKAWLSGGRLVVNKKTWYAHWQRGRKHSGNEIKKDNRHYHLPRETVRFAHRYAKDLWFNNKWPLQKHKFKWLIEKFAPVPGWENGCPESYQKTV